MALSANHREMLNKATITNFKIGLGDVIHEALEEATANTVADLADAKLTNLKLARGDQGHAANSLRLSRTVADLEKSLVANTKELNIIKGAMATAATQNNANRLLINTHHKAFVRRETVGGTATEEFLLAGVTASDQVLVQLHTVGAVPVSIISSKCLDGKISVTFSGDPADDHIVTCYVGA